MKTPAEAPETVDSILQLIREAGGKIEDVITQIGPGAWQATLDYVRWTGIVSAIMLTTALTATWWVCAKLWHTYEGIDDRNGDRSCARGFTMLAALVVSSGLIFIGDLVEQVAKAVSPAGYLIMQVFK